MKRIYICPFNTIFEFSIVAMVIMLLFSANLAAAPGPQTAAEESAPAVKLDFSGSQSWILKYGLGDPKGLTRKGYSNQLTIEMPLAVTIEGAVPVDWPVSGKLSVSAELDNQRSDNLQSLAINFDTQNFSGGFGKFTVGEKTSFAVYNKKMMGLKAEGAFQNLSLTGMLARVEGISETITFRGNTSSDEIIYSLYLSDRPWEEKPYLTSIWGLEFYKLKDVFVEGFTEIKLRFKKEGLNEFFSSYELGYLTASVSKENEKELKKGLYEVISSYQDQYLILKKEIKALLRSALRDYIDDYNRQNQLEGEDKKKYPFNRGTEYEEKFLSTLADWVSIVVGDYTYPIDEYERKRFYYLGHGKVEPQSVLIEVKKDGDFRPIDDPKFDGYDYQLFPEVGIVEFLFPADFFADLETNQIKVKYDYQVTQDIYMLGLSIIKGSEKVYLNGERLKRGQDYTIDYETGSLLVFVDVGPEDTLRIDFERSRGGLGGYAEYKRNFAGSTLHYKALDTMDFTLECLRAWDQPGSNQELSRLRSMPNDHLILGLEGKMEMGWLKGALKFGYNRNRFPFDDRQRENQVNRINSILPITRDGKSYVLFAHQNGITVFDGEKWSNFSTGDGLSGRTVYDIAISSDASLIVFATETGISVLTWPQDETLTESLAKVERWRRFYEDDGLPTPQVLKAYIDQKVLWLGTTGGLVKVPIGKLESSASWVTYNKDLYPNMISDRITELTVAKDFLYLGTDDGLMTYSPGENVFQKVAELDHIKINDLTTYEESIHAATSQGIAIITRGRFLGWKLGGVNVTSLSKSDNLLVYGTKEGLYLLGEDEPMIRGWGITAISGEERFWIGPLAKSRGEEYYLSVWSMEKATFKTTRYPKDITHIEGKDLYRFQDIPSNQHTDRGTFKSLSFTQKLGKITLRETFDSVSPQFSRIGKTERRDFQQWKVSADYALAPKITLSGTHINKTANVHSDSPQPPELTVANSLKLSWKRGTNIELGVNLERKDNKQENGGFDRRTLTFTGSASESFFEDLLSLSLSYQDSLFWNLVENAPVNRKRKLVSQIDVKPNQDTVLSLKYIEPTKGQRNMDISFVWSEKFQNLSIDTDFNHQIKWGVSSLGNLRSDDILETSFGLNTLKLGELKVHPRATFNLQGNAGSGVIDLDWESLQLLGRGTLAGEYGNTNFKLTYKRDIRFNRLSKRESTFDQAELKIKLPDYNNFSPRLMLKIVEDRLAHPRFPTQKSSSKLAQFTLGWSPNQEIQNLSSLSWEILNREKETVHTYSLSDTLHWKISDMFSSKTKVEGNYSKGSVRENKKDRLAMELAHTLSSRLAKDWRASLAGGYLLGMGKETADNYQSFTGKLVISTTF